MRVHASWHVQAAQKLCVLLAGCMVQRISAGLAALPRPPAPAEAMQPCPRLLPSDAMHLAAAEQAVNPAPAAGHVSADGSVLRPDEAPHSTPQKAPPASAGGGPEQVSQRANQQATPGPKVCSACISSCFTHPKAHSHVCTLRLPLQRPTRHTWCAG